MNDESIEAMLRAARRAGRALAVSEEQQRNNTLEAVAVALEHAMREVLDANARDMERAQNAGIAPSMLDRLLLNESRYAGVVRSVREVKTLPDPLGEVRELGTR